MSFYRYLHDYDESVHLDQIILHFVMHASPNPCKTKKKHKSGKTFSGNKIKTKLQTSSFARLKWMETINMYILNRLIGFFWVLVYVWDSISLHHQYYYKRREKTVKLCAIKQKFCARSLSSPMMPRLGQASPSFQTHKHTYLHTKYYCLQCIQNFMWNQFERTKAR